MLCVLYAFLYLIAWSQRTETTPRYAVIVGLFSPCIRSLLTLHLFCFSPDLRPVPFFDIPKVGRREQREPGIHTHTHTHTHVCVCVDIYIYIYYITERTSNMCVCACVYLCICLLQKTERTFKYFTTNQHKSSKSTMSMTPPPPRKYAHHTYANMRIILYAYHLYVIWGGGYILRCVWYIRKYAYDTQDIRKYAYHTCVHTNIVVCEEEDTY